MVHVLRIRMARLHIEQHKSRRKFLNKSRVDTDLRHDRSCNVIAMIHNVWNMALSQSLESICLGSWELNRDLNTVSLHVRHGVWNHGPLQWCHNERDDIWNHRRLDYLLRRRSKKTSTLHVTGLCEGKSTIWWHLHATGATNCSHESSDYQRMKPQSSPFTVLCEGNTRVSSGFSLQRASNMESVSMSWHHHGMEKLSISHDACNNFLSVGIVLCHCTIYAYHGQMY